MLEELLAAGDKALVFTQFTEMGDIIRRHLQETFGREVLFLHGGTSRKQRDAMVERYQSTAGPPVFLLSLKAGGTGLNLTAATHVFHFDRWWNPAVETQAIATCMYYTGIDPFTKQTVAIAKGLNDRKMQRALMQFFKPENYFEVREALIQAKRTDLIGGCDGMIPANPPKEAIEARRKRANQGGDHYHTVANPAKGEKPGEQGAEPAKTGYRPGRKTQKRRQGKKG